MKYMWAILAPEKYKLRYDFFYKKIAEKNVHTELQILSPKDEDLQSILEKLLSEKQNLIVDSSYVDLVWPLLTQQTEESQRYKLFDILVYNNSSWWPRSVHVDAIKRELSHVLRQPDPSEPVMITGSGAMARQGLLAFMQAGYSKFNITDIDLSVAQKNFSSLQKFAFDLELRFTPFEKISLLPGVHGILLNTLDTKLQAESIQDLLYFNFLKSTGIVIDLDFQIEPSPILHAASTIGLKTVDADRIFATADCLTAELFWSEKWDLTDYQEKIHQFLEATLTSSTTQTKV